MIELIKKYLGNKVAAFIALVALGFSLALAYPNYVVTPEVFSQEVAKIERKVDTNVAALKIANADLELSILRKEKNEILDIIDAGRAKQRHRDRLEEIKDRIKKLDEAKKEYYKILEGQAK